MPVTRPPASHLAVLTLGIVLLAGVAAANEPPAVVIDGPATATVGDVVTFDGSASSDPDGTIVSYRWSFNTTGPTAQARFTAPGTHRITLNVRDDDGNVTHESVWVDVVDDSPTVTVSANASTVRVGEPVRLTATATGSITGYDWSGSLPDRGSTVVHRFDQAGRTNVGVVVTDEQGRSAAANVTITVEEEPLPPDTAPTGAVVTPGDPTASIVATVLGAIIAAGLLLRARPDPRPRPEEVRDDEPPYNI